MHKIWVAAALCSALAFSGAAQAQSWGAYVGNGGGRDYDGPRYGYGGDGQVQAVCSGARAHQLEDRLRHEVDEDEIDNWQADRIHNQIDRLEDRQRHECAEGDWRSIQSIAARYDQLDRWIESQAHGRW